MYLLDQMFTLLEKYEVPDFTWLTIINGKKTGRHAIVHEIVLKCIDESNRILVHDVDAVILEPDKIIYPPERTYPFKIKNVLLNKDFYRKFLGAYIAETNENITLFKPAFYCWSINCSEFKDNRLILLGNAKFDSGRNNQEWKKELR